MYEGEFEVFDDDLWANTTSPVADLEPRDPRRVLARVLETLTQTFVGDDGGALDETLSVLALHLCRFICAPFALRLTLVGPTGSGKTRLLRALAQITGAPGVVIPATDVAETNWRGSQLGDACRVLHPHLFTGRSSAGRVLVPTATVDLPSVVLIDEFDKLALVSHDGRAFDGSSAGARVGRQQALMPMLDPLSELLVKFEDADTGFRWSLCNSIVMCAGAFSMLPTNTRVTTSALLRVGYSAEIADRLGTIIQLPSPSSTACVAACENAADEVLSFAASLGVDRIVGLPALLASMPLPGPDAPYAGLRGMRHYVEHRVTAAVVRAMAHQQTTAHIVSDAVPS